MSLKETNQNSGILSKKEGSMIETRRMQKLFIERKHGTRWCIPWGKDDLKTRPLKVYVE